MKHLYDFIRKRGVDLLARVYSFPSQDDINVIKTAVSSFLYSQKNIHRKLMLHSIGSILKRYNISRLRLPYYIIEQKRNGLPAIYARQITREKSCPGCNEAIFTVQSKVRILSIKEYYNKHTVTYGCKCGLVFGRHEAIE